MPGPGMDWPVPMGRTGGACRPDTGRGTRRLAAWINQDPAPSGLVLRLESVRLDPLFGAFVRAALLGVQNVL